MASEGQLDNIFFAKLAESAERYDDMVDSVKRIVSEKKAISDEERNLLSVAYKNCVGTRRASWRVLSSIEQREELNGDSKSGSTFVAVIKKYRTEVEVELKRWCNEIIAMLADTLIPSASENDSKVFLMKMKGDYYRYLAEFSTGTDRKDYAEQSLAAYKSASDVAMTELAPTNPIRLGLALNLSVFYYEILNSPDKACRLAKNAFDDAMAELDTLNDNSYKDSTLIMQLLRDNLTLWTTDMEADEKEDDVNKEEKADGGGDKD